MIDARGGKAENVRRSLSQPDLLIVALSIAAAGFPVLETEDQDGNRERVRVNPDEIPSHLANDYERLRDDYRDALEGGHEAEARHAYLWGIGAV